jgi:Fur family ferric uptake transcriptional regulator
LSEHVHNPVRRTGFDGWRDLFIDRISRDNQRMTPQRLQIAETLYHHGHLNVDELHRRVRDIDPTVGYATVYRTLKLLERYRLVEVSHFADGTARYEVHVGGDEHHDHMICTRCGKIVEFENGAIETLQDEIARAHGFKLTHHRMDLFGLCPSCH